MQALAFAEQTITFCTLRAVDKRRLLRALQAPVKLRQTASAPQKVCVQANGPEARLRALGYIAGLNHSIKS